MQTFSARQENRAKTIRPYELALYCVQGYEIWQETPEEMRVARAEHPEDLEDVAIEDTAHTMKLGG